MRVADQEKSLNQHGIFDSWPSTQEDCTAWVHSVDPRCSNHAQFARSFKVPAKDCHVFIEHASEGPSGVRRNAEVQLRSCEHEATGEKCDRFRTGTHIWARRIWRSGNIKIGWQGSSASSRNGPRKVINDFSILRSSRSNVQNQGKNIPFECRAEDIHNEAQDETQGRSTSDLSGPCGERAGYERRGFLRATADGGGDADRCPRDAERWSRTSGDADVAHGRCPGRDLGPLGESNPWVGSAVDPCPIWEHSLYAGDLHDNPEDHISEAPETNMERNKFNKLIKQLSREFHACQENPPVTASRIDVLEVFCNPQSQLTHQCIQLGQRAMHFGLPEGDLQTPEGRHQMFQVVLKYRPRHIWFSPKCGPWSGWSNLNGSKSIQAWDALQQSRLQHLDQIALGIVLMRNQRNQGCHFHWEQPQSSHMFRLPYLQEVRQPCLWICVRQETPLTQIPMYISAKL